jgi:hypothetical protein
VKATGADGRLWICGVGEYCSRAICGESAGGDVVFDERALDDEGAEQVNREAAPVGFAAGRTSHLGGADGQRLPPVPGASSWLREERRTSSDRNDV